MPIMNQKSDSIFLLLYSPGVENRFDEPIEGRIRLMKGLFLMSREKEFSELSYEFVPYLYGPVSFDVYSDLAELVRKGLVVDDKSKEPEAGYYYLTTEGIAKGESLFNALPPETQEKVRQIKCLINQKSFIGLLKYVYSNYPEFAVRSVLSIT